MGKLPRAAQWKMAKGHWDHVTPRSVRFLVLCAEPGAAGATPMQATEAMGFECNNECVLDSLMDWHHEMTIFCFREVTREGHFMVMVVLEAVVRAVLAKEECFKATFVLETLCRTVVGGVRAEPEGMIAAEFRPLLRILMLNWSSIMQQQ
uniref:Uncharacterized protein n=1 Tax=Aegilops tauschii TaxID=37682 RepID=M8BES9_AEGTA